MHTTCINHHKYLAKKGPLGGWVFYPVPDAPPWDYDESRGKGLPCGSLALTMEWSLLVCVLHHLLQLILDYWKVYRWVWFLYYSVYHKWLSLGQTRLRDSSYICSQGKFPREIPTEADGGWCPPPPPSHCYTELTLMALAPPPQPEWRTYTTPHYAVAGPTHPPS